MVSLVLRASVAALRAQPPFRAPARGSLAPGTEPRGTASVLINTRVPSVGADALGHSSGRSCRSDCNAYESPESRVIAVAQFDNRNTPSSLKGNARPDEGGVVNDLLCLSHLR